MLKFLALAMVGAVFGLPSAWAHTVDLGYVDVPGACSAVRGDDKRSPGQQSQTQRVQYDAGRAHLSVLLIPTTPLKENKPDDPMNTCAAEAYKSLIGASPNRTEVGEESVFRKVINECLTRKGTAYKVETAIFRRAPVDCPSACSVQACGVVNKTSCDITCPAGRNSSCSCDCINRFFGVCTELKESCSCKAAQ